MLTLELAKPQEDDICYDMVDQCRRFQREQGFVQWTDDYPDRESVRQDIEAGRGYVLREDGRIAGYMCVDFDGDPAYDDIRDGGWGTKEPYVVVHRMAFDRAARGRGLASKAFALVEKLCLDRGVESIRIDTGFENVRMQHVLEKNGFRRRGTVIFARGERTAYDKTIIRLVPAAAQDLPICCAMIAAGREFQRKQGFVQWTESYPGESVVKEDIDKGSAFLIEAGRAAIGYVCVSFEREPAYDKLEGSWAAEKPYAVVNRLVFNEAGRGRGLTEAVMAQIEETCRRRGVDYIRTNTFALNGRMRRALEKCGFCRRGRLNFRGGEKIAYDKSL